ncbi:MAG: hypothetical protein H8Z69_01675 [Nanohaloarchaea archaeon]|nr:hypothetical protein [Candidatus Nanohaloarchaea archaeon]
MGVLGPLKRNAEELEELKETYSGMIGMTKENLERYAGAILNDRHDLMDEEDPFFFLVWRDDDVMDISSIEELEKEIENLEMLKEDVSLSALSGKYAEIFAKKKDVEPDYENPLESYGELDEVENQLENLHESIDSKIVEQFDLDQDRAEQEYDMVDYKVLEIFYTFSDHITALPIPEAITEAKQNIKHEKENLLAKAVDEHREHKESIEHKYERTEIPLEPVDWEQVVEEEKIKDFMDISDMPTVTYGDTLHLMMEQKAEDIEGVEPEYPLHFLNKGRSKDVDRETRIDNTLRPDAVDDLFVYEFKHLPKKQKEFLEQNGEVEMNGKHKENVEQVNMYLNELDLPAGMLVYISSDMEIKEYVVERFDERDGENGYSEFIHEREDYNFETIGSKL